MIRMGAALAAGRLAAIVIVAAASLNAQAPADVYQRFAPVDLTGTWVSVVTEDWAMRMIVPKKGDFSNLPLTKSAQDAANNANMADVEAAGRACDAYGAPIIMREPGRVRISWQDSATLKIETDAGEQTRLLHFGAAKPGDPPSRQGFSFAEWQYANGFDPEHAPARGDLAAARGDRGGGGRAGGGGRGGGGFGRGPAGATTPNGGRLKVETSNLTPGFLRKNGVPYSANTKVTEYYNLLTEPTTSAKWFVVTTIVHDPANLAVDYITSTNFRQEADGSKWRPRPCSLK
jgi:hypothetical protein